LSLSGNTLTYSISYRGLKAGATAAHIHGPGTTDQAVGVLVALTGAAGTEGVLSGTLNLTDEQKGHILAGRTYVNLYTSAHPGGEIRGQIAPAELKVTLSGAAERPNPVTTAATAAHIHGPATTEQAAGVLKGLATPSGTSGRLTGSITLDLAQLSALLDGKTYVNIHTTGQGGGELRGQILP